LQILRSDLKNGRLKLRVDNLDDLWILHNILQPGDLVLAKTFRREKVDTEDSRPERGEKKPVFLGIRIEKVELHKYVNMIRLIGRIERGIDLGSYHTINVQPGSIFSIVRDWKRSELDTLKEAVQESRRPKILIVSLEEGEASFGIVRQRGVDLINDLFANIPGKREKSARESLRGEFYNEVLGAIMEVAESQGIRDVLVVGPELTRTSFKAYVEDHPDLLSGLNVTYDTCFSPGRTGIYEAIRRGAVDRMVTSSRVSLEMTRVEQFLSEVSKGGKATYGLREVKMATEAGAVESLLITDRFFRDRRDEADALIQRVKRYRGSHLIISTDHEAGTKLQSLGGLGAILRYRLSQADRGKPSPSREKHETKQT